MAEVVCDWAATSPEGIDATSRHASNPVRRRLPRLATMLAETPAMESKTRFMGTLWCWAGGLGRHGHALDDPSRENTLRVLYAESQSRMT